MARWAAPLAPLCDEGALSRWKNLRGSPAAATLDPVARAGGPCRRRPGAPEASTSVRADPRSGEPTPRHGAPRRRRGADRATGRRAAPPARGGHRRRRGAGEGARGVEAEGPRGEDVPVPRRSRPSPGARRVARRVAVGLSGKPVALGGLWLERRLTAAWKACGLPGTTPGDATPGAFATEMSRRPGVSVRDVQRLLGHADLGPPSATWGRYRSDADRPARRHGPRGGAARGGGRHGAPAPARLGLYRTCTVDRYRCGSSGAS